MAQQSYSAIHSNSYTQWVYYSLSITICECFSSL